MHLSKWNSSTHFNITPWHQDATRLCPSTAFVNGTSQPASPKFVDNKMPQDGAKSLLLSEWSSLFHYNIVPQHETLQYHSLPLRCHKIDRTGPTFAQIKLPNSLQHCSETRRSDKIPLKRYFDQTKAPNFTSTQFIGTKTPQDGSEVIVCSVREGNVWTIPDYFFFVQLPIFQRNST